jgi:hypothetical protein
VYGTYAKRTGPDDDYPWCETAQERADYAAAVEREWGFEADLTRMAPSADESLARWWMARARAAASPGSARDLVVMNSGGSAGDVLVSVTTRDLVAGSGLAFEDRGEAELKGIGTRRLYAARDT